MCLFFQVLSRRGAAPIAGDTLIRGYYAKRILHATGSDRLKTLLYFYFYPSLHQGFAFTSTNLYIFPLPLCLHLKGQL